MSALPAQIPSPQSPSQGFRPGEQAALQLEVAKCLQLVVPASMTADDRAAWILAAVDSLEDIRPIEVASVSAEVRRLVTHPRQIVPEIARLVDEKRKRARNSAPPPQGGRYAFEIEREAQDRRSRARNQAEVEAAARWERTARLDAGLSVPPTEPPLSRLELGNMPQHIASLGMKYRFLERRDGQLFETGAS